ncbi:MAG: hypothetical protein WDO56_03105 [Gammaproteobacteria bacterium]
MKMDARFDSVARLALLAAFAVSLAACKKPEMPTPTPEPKAAASAQTEVTQSDSGTTTTYPPPAQ